MNLNVLLALTLFFCTKTYGDSFSLQEAIQTAFKKNPITQANDLRLEAAKDRARGAWLDLYPSGSISVSHGVNNYRSENNGIHSEGHSSYGGWDVGLSMNLYRGGADLNRARAAEKDVEAQEATNNSTNALIPDTKGSLANEVYSAYLSIVSNKLQLEFFSTQRKYLEVFLTAAKTSDDRNQIETAIQDTDNTLLSIKRSVQKSNKAYEYLVKTPTPQKLDNLDSIADSLVIPETTSDAIIIAEQKSPEIKIAQASLEAAKFNKQAQRAESFSPRVDLSINRGHSYYDSIGTNSKSLDTSARITVSIPFGASKWAYSSATSKEVEAKEQDLTKVIDRLRFVLEDELYVSLDNYDVLTRRYYQTLIKISTDLTEIVDKINNQQPVDIKYALSTLSNQSSQFYSYLHNHRSLVDTKFEIQKTIGTLFTSVDEMTAQSF